MIFGNDEKKHNYLSPFAKYNIKVNGINFVSVYNYYVYTKFKGSSDMFLKGIPTINNERVLMQISNSRQNKIILNWDSAKYDIMKRGYLMLFEQHTSAKSSFADLYADSYNYNIPSFTYWGYSGLNKMNSLLLELRILYGYTKPICVHSIAISNEQKPLETKKHSLTTHEKSPDNINNDDILLLYLSKIELENTNKINNIDIQDDINILNCLNED